jgi:hypothetical protein
MNCNGNGGRTLPAAASPAHFCCLEFLHLLCAGASDRIPVRCDIFLLFFMSHTLQWTFEVSARESTRRHPSMQGPGQGHRESSCKPKPYQYAYRYRDVAPPASAKTCYKLVAICGGRFVSIYDGCTEYEVGCTMWQEVTCRMGAQSDVKFVTLPEIGATKSWRWLLRV